MSAAIVTIQFVVSPDHRPGDYALLHSNGGAGDIDWETPLRATHIDLFPGGAGIFGWRHLPWRHFPWRHGMSVGTPGWRHLPWRHFPWRHGATVVTTTDRVTACGTYKYGLAAYDAAGNAHAGAPDEVELEIHVAPPKASRLKKTSYDKSTDTLILEVA